MIILEPHRHTRIAHCCITSNARHQGTYPGPRLPALCGAHNTFDYVSAGKQWHLVREALPHMCC